MVPLVRGRALLSGVLLSLFHISCGVRTGQDGSERGWNIQPNGSGLEVDWNRNAPELKGQRSVTLLVQDGSNRSEYPLDRTVGTLFLTPESDDVSLNLHVAMAEGVPDRTIALYENRNSARRMRVSVSSRATGKAEIRTSTEVRSTVQPQVPESLVRRLGGRKLEVTVFVKINESGWVASVSTQWPADPLEREFAERATEAAQQWRFEPVRVNGRAVYGDAQLSSSVSGQLTAATSIPAFGMGHWEAMSPALRRALYAGVIFWSALLLLLVQPVLTRAILPWFGGSAGVWTTSMLFYQTVLLLGYLYAHLVTRRLPARAQVALHASLLIAACLLLPLRPSRRGSQLMARSPYPEFCFSCSPRPAFLISCSPRRAHCCRRGMRGPFGRTFPGACSQCRTQDLSRRCSPIRC